LKALEKFRKTETALKCKKCTAAQEEKERLAAAALKGNAANNETASTVANADPVKCAACKQSLPPPDFNRNQLAKKEKARCRKCVEKAIQTEESSRDASRENKLEDVRKKIKEMELKHDIPGRVRYESELSALEAEYVTGLKPVKMNGGRGGWRNRGGRGGRGGGSEVMLP